MSVDAENGPQETNYVIAERMKGWDKVACAEKVGHKSAQALNVAFVVDRERVSDEEEKVEKDSQRPHVDLWTNVWSTEDHLGWAIR
jgi:hypothetical protein